MQLKEGKKKGKKERGKGRKKVTLIFHNNYSAGQINQQCDRTSLLFKTFSTENNSEIDVLLILFPSRVAIWTLLPC